MTGSKRKIRFEEKNMLCELLEQYGRELELYRPYPAITDRDGWNGLDEEWKRKAVELGESYLDFSWPYLTATEYMDFTRTGDRGRFESRYFSKRYALNALALAECVEDKGRFIDDIINGIYAICDEGSWNLPAHNYKDHYGTGYLPLPDINDPIIDLLACETAATLATAIYLLQPVLDQVSERIAQRVEYELKRRVFAPYLEDYIFWIGNGEGKLGNWTAWCTQNVFYAAFLSNYERRDEVLARGCKSLDQFLGSYGEDGCCSEGAGYYRHAGLCLSGALRMCNAVTGGAFKKAYQDSKVRNIASYIHKVHVNDVYYLNFADGLPFAGRAGVREYLFAKETDNPDMMAFAAEDFRRGMPGTLMMPGEYNLFYRLQNAFNAAEVRAYREEESGRGMDVFYPSVGLMIVRDDSLLLAAKAGDNDDGHNHNDVGSIIVYKDGQPLIIDVGPEAYNNKTFTAHRYEIWTTQSSHHNAPEINGYMQLPGAERCASDTVCDLESATLSMNLERAYPEECGIASYRRKASLIKGKEIVIKDSFLWKQGKNGHVVMNLMTARKPVLMENNQKDGQLVHIGEEKEFIGSVLLKNAHVEEIQRISVEDKNLKRVWDKEVFRIRLVPDNLEFTIKIF